jgi:hypothetical protein
MHFNEAKFKVVRFWADRSDAPDILYMAPDGGPIKDCTQDLGSRLVLNLCSVPRWTVKWPPAAP